MQATAENVRFNEITKFGESVKTLFKEGGFTDNMYSLIEIRDGYHDAKTNLSESINSAYEKGERFADIVDMTGATEKNGFLKMKYIQKPTVILKSLRTGAYSVSGGIVIPYDCPPDGFAIPADGVLYHPQIGAAVATTRDKEKAVKLIVEHIKKTPRTILSYKDTAKMARRVFR